MLIIISGAQTGADVAGLLAAQDSGLKTSGMMPKGFITQFGPKPEWAKQFNLFEAKVAGYKYRTWKNIEASDATLRLAQNFWSAGEICTLNGIKKFNKPYMDVDLNKEDNNPQDVVDFINEHNVRILNVAGNSEKTCPGITTLAYNFLIEVFKLLDK